MVRHVEYLNLLPIEIIKDIFDLCLEALGDSEAPPSAVRKAKSIFSTRACLMQVSKSWKTLVETTPSMWTTILVLQSNEVEWRIKYAEDSVIRSHPLPIDVIIRMPRSPNNTIKAFMGFLSDYVERLRIFMGQVLLEVSIPIRPAFPIVNELFRPRTKHSITLPYLHSFEAWTSRCDAELFPHINAPALDSISLHGRVIDFISTLDQFSLARITSLSLSGTLTWAGLFLVSHCVSLRRFQYNGGRPIGSPDLQAPLPITLPLLEELRNLEEDVNSFWLGQYFILPKLTKLSYRTFFHSGDSSATLGTIRAFSSTLNELSLNAITLYGTGDHNETPHYPDLRKLTIARGRLGFGFLETLNAQDSTDIPFFPVLEELVFNKSEDIDVSELGKFLNIRKALFADTNWASSVKLVFKGMDAKKNNSPLIEALRKQNFEVELLP
ncbi:hypothetical protein M422DRAFT_28356 [Sphaerobolus stellatus SS14]|nr:hypothetical protein M422DRAFT_28356 [Sphaerobolus stellatus SS14]